LPKIDLILLSHNHYDHLDRPTLRTLTRVHSPAIIAPCGVSRTLPITTRRSTRELDWWQQTEIGGLRIMCVPARHFSARSLRDRNHSLWCGFVIETAAPRGDSAANFISREWRPAVYFAGDTGWGKHFAEIGDRFPGITTALLPIGAYLPRWFMAPVHLAPDEAVNAQHAIGARLAFAMHFGTFALADDGEDEPVQALAEARKASPADFRVPQPGIAVAFRLDGAGELRESTA
jgi:L-ascorbate metabolism protein UlaG (beta-lactamase superfamily)